ncbi:MAG: exodeoxyribonuclease VII large subunit, partial [Myxococcales bacterium]|nr:exodeoxyribonuclease VII large subunit [Myxococcales bacterium]
LLDGDRKRRLPLFPKTVGVVTSASGAALHDIVRVARGRAAVRLVVADCRVQGEGSAASIVRALEAVQRLPELDVVILSRGGGAAEDLGSFNDEAVARAIAACRVPVVSGVGHEVDTTIADLVADLRAATPSNAAELVVPEERALRERIEGDRRRMVRAMTTEFGRARLRIERLERLVRDPRRGLWAIRERLSFLRASLARAGGRLGTERRRSLDRLARRLITHDVRTRLGEDRGALGRLRTRLREAGPPMVATRQRRHGQLVARLDALSPLKVLARGYAIAIHGPTGRALLRADEASPGDALTLRLHEGDLRARVEP